MFLFSFSVFIPEVVNQFFKIFNSVTKIKNINSLISQRFSIFVVGSNDAEGYRGFVDVYEIMKLNFFNFHTIFPRCKNLPVMRKFF